MMSGGQLAPGFLSGQTNTFIIDHLHLPSFETKTLKKKERKTPGWHGNLVKILISVSLTTILSMA